MSATPRVGWHDADTDVPAYERGRVASGCTALRDHHPRRLQRAALGCSTWQRSASSSRGSSGCRSRARRRADRPGARRGGQPPRRTPTRRGCSASSSRCSPADGSSCRCCGSRRSSPARSRSPPASVSLRRFAQRPNEVLVLGQLLDTPVRSTIPTTPGMDAVVVDAAHGADPRPATGWSPGSRCGSAAAARAGAGSVAGRRLERGHRADAQPTGQGTAGAARACSRRCGPPTSPDAARAAGQAAPRGGQRARRRAARRRLAGAARGRPGRAAGAARRRARRRRARGDGPRRRRRPARRAARRRRRAAARA